MTEIENETNKMAAAASTTLVPIEHRTTEYLPREVPKEWMKAFFLKYLDQFLDAIVESYPAESFPAFDAIHAGIANFQRQTRTIFFDKDPAREDRRREEFSSAVIDAFAGLFVTNSALFRAAMAHDFWATVKALPMQFAAAFKIKSVAMQLQPNADTIFAYTDILLGSGLVYVIAKVFPPRTLKQMSSLTKTAVTAPAASRPTETDPMLNAVLSSMAGCLPPGAADIVKMMQSELGAIARDLQATLDGEPDVGEKFAMLMKVLPNFMEYTKFMKSLPPDNPFAIDLSTFWANVDKLCE